MLLLKTGAPSLQSRYVAYPSDDVGHQSFAIALGENVEGDEAEHDDDAQQGGDGRVDGQIADSSQCQVDEDAGEPVPEMGKEVHHRIEDDRRRCALVADILRQLHDAVRLTAQTSHGCGIVQGIARNRQTVDTPEAYLLACACAVELRLPAFAADNRLPGKGVDAIDEEPYANDRY